MALFKKLRGYIRLAFCRSRLRWIFPCKPSGACYACASLCFALLSGDQCGQRERVVVCSSMALISNILRELITLFTAPFLVRIFGKLAPISAGGVTSMDITLPVIIRFSGKQYAALAVFHCAVLDPLVPVLVGVFSAV